MKGKVIMEDIYLDHAATTPIHPDVIETMYPVYNNTFGNPSSIHAFGRKARQLLDESRAIVADSIEAEERDVIFTSGGTEANNLALIGVALAQSSKGRHIITTMQEHSSVLKAVEYLETIGFDVTYVPVDTRGRVAIEDICEALTDETIMVSVMYVNNETGILQPIKAIGKVLKEHQAYFHTDAVQAFGLIDINVKQLNIDLLSVSSHKINGPKGIGALYIENHTNVKARQHGGNQERQNRPGTENLPGIVGFGKAIEIMQVERKQRRITYETYKRAFINRLNYHKIDFKLNGNQDQTIGSIVNINFPEIDFETLLMNLDLAHVAASSGSACTAGSLEPSYVLTAMFGAHDETARHSIRFSFGMGLSLELVEEAADRTAQIIQRLNK